MGPDAARTTRPADQSLNDMVASLAQEAIGKGSTTLLDDEMGSFGVPNPRILIVGCGGSGNNTLNRHNQRLGYVDLVLQMSPSHRLVA